MSRRRAWPALPIAPLLEVLEMSAPGHGHRPATRLGLCRRAGVHHRSFLRWVERGDLPPAAADRLAVALGLHPVLVWPDEWLTVLDRRWRPDARVDGVRGSAA